MSNQITRVLIVEDDESHVSLIRHAFKDYSDQFHIQVAHTLEEARACLNKDQSDPHVVIADIRLPDGLGTDLLPPDSEHSPYPVIVMTSYGNEQSAVDAMKAGALDYIVKSKQTFADMPNNVERVLREWVQIRDRKRAEQALRESEEKYRLLVENQTEIVSEIDPDGKVLFISPSFSETFGIPEDEILGKEFIHLIHKDNHKHFIRAIEKVLQPPHTHPRGTEVRVKTKDGWRWFSWTLNGVFDEKDSILKIVSVGRDINDRKLADQKLRALVAKRKELEHIINQSPAVLFLWRNEEGWPVEFVSDNVKQFGYAPDDFYSGRVPYANIVHPDDLERVAGEVARYSSEEDHQSYDQEYRIITRTGEVRWTDDRTWIRRDRNGKITHFQGIILDITDRKQAEEALRESEEKLSNAVKMARVGYWELDVPTDTFTFNDHFYSIFRTTAEEVGGYTMSSAEYARRFVHPDDVSVVGQETRKAMETTDSSFSRKLEHRMIFGDGTEGYISVRFFIVKDNEGRTIKTYGVNQDITDRKRAEERIKRLAMVADQAVEGIAWADIDGILLYTNPAWKNLHGYEADEKLIGKHLSILHTEVQLRTDVIPFNEEVKRSGSHVGEVGHVRKDGTTFQAEMRVTLFRDEQGAPIGLIAFMVDITERKRAEKEQVRLAEIIRQASEIVVVTDLDGNIEYVNPAFERVSGYSAEEVIGQSMRPLHAIEDDESFWQELGRLVSRGEDWVGRVTKKKKDGSVYEEQMSLFPVRDLSGELVNYVSIGRDMTDQIALENELHRAQKLESIGQLAAGIAHEINTPMQYIGDNTQFLKDSFSDLVGLIRMFTESCEAAKSGDLTEERIEEVRKAAEEADVEFLSEEIPKSIEQSIEGIERVSAIVKAMKAFSHMGLDEKKSVDINKEISSTITVSRNEWKYISDLVTDFDESLPAVECFAGEFNQVILNLITNAAHAIANKIGDSPDEKGMITISTRRDSDWVEIRVTDTGTGIPDNIREKVFDPFFTTKQVGKGSGQGLSIAHSVVTEKHGGTITFETVVGEGSTFIIRLPISSESDVTEELPEEVGSVT